MGGHGVHLIGAACGSRSVASEAFGLVRRADRQPRGGHVAAALLEKGSSGGLAVTLEYNPADSPLWRRCLLGAALAVLVAPVGIQRLAETVGSRAEWAGVVAVVGDLWYDVPKQTLRVMGDLLEATQASLLVVAVDRRDPIELLSATAATVVVESVDVDVEADFVDATRRASEAL